MSELRYMREPSPPFNEEQFQQEIREWTNKFYAMHELVFAHPEYHAPEFTSTYSSDLSGQLGQQVSAKIREINSQKTPIETHFFSKTDPQNFMFLYLYSSTPGQPAEFDWILRDFQIGENQEVLVRIFGKSTGEVLTRYADWFKVPHDKLERINRFYSNPHTYLNPLKDSYISSANMLMSVPALDNYREMLEKLENFHPFRLRWWGMHREHLYSAASDQAYRNTGNPDGLYLQAVPPYPRMYTETYIPTSVYNQEGEVVGGTIARLLESSERPQTFGSIEHGTSTYHTFLRYKDLHRFDH